MHIISPPRGPLDPLQLIKSTCLTSLYQALWRHTRKHCVKFSLGQTAYKPEKLSFSGLMLVLIFLILNILRYMRVYAVI